MAKMLFVCGFPSGGTDLTKTILNAHPDVHLNGEMPFLRNIAEHGYHQSTVFTDLTEIEDFQRVLKNLNTWGNIENIDYDFSAALEARGKLQLDHVLRICFSSQERQVWGNKTPQNTENIAALSMLFPEAYFLIVTRDVRDICLSWKRKWGKDMIWCASKWANRMAKGWEAAQKLSSEKYLFVKFEDILSDTEVVCRGICQLLDIPFSDRMLEHHKHTSEAIDGKLNYGEPIKRDNKQKWRDHLPDRTAKRIEEIAFETMNIFDYEIAFAFAPEPISRGEKLRGMLKDACALLFIGNRASQQNTLAQRARKIFFELRKQILS
jgi:hypothetical protein